jgi:hypothetical protein
MRSERAQVSEGVPRDATCFTASFSGFAPSSSLALGQ